MTDPDEDLLQFVAACEVVLATQTAELLGISEQAASDRLDKLRNRRLVSRVTPTTRLPSAYRLTHRGAEQIDAALPPLRALNMSRYRHEIGVSWLSAAGRLGRLGRLRAVLSRREMQAADATRRSAVLLDAIGAVFRDQPAGGTQPDARDLYPDLALVQATGSWATVDLIHTPPEPQRLRAMLTRQHRQPLIAAQLFMVEPHDQIAEAINRAAQQLGLEDKVHVQLLSDDGIAGV